MTNANADIIGDVIKREGGNKATNDPNDAGGRTQYGISERSHPEAWTDGKVTEQEARAIYEAKYIKAPGFDRIPPSRLQEQLIDFGVHSGAAIAIQKLQALVGASVDGVLGPRTLESLNGHDLRVVNNQLVAERVKMLGRIVAKSPSQLKYLNGWLTRALEFLEP